MGVGGGGKSMCIWRRAHVFVRERGGVCVRKRETEGRGWWREWKGAKEREQDRQTDRQTDWQTHRQTDRQTDREKEIERDRQKHTETHRETAPPPPTHPSHPPPPLPPEFHSRSNSRRKYNSFSPRLFQAVSIRVICYRLTIKRPRWKVKQKPIICSSFFFSFFCAFRKNAVSLSKPTPMSPEDNNHVRLVTLHYSRSLLSVFKAFLFLTFSFFSFYFPFSFFYQEKGQLCQNGAVTSLDFVQTVCRSTANV